MNQQTIQTILETFAVLLGLYLAFFKSYFQEKGKNLATEQDIQKITILVEEAKKQFTQDIELLRNRLNLYAQNFNSIKTLERNALIEINTKYSEWLQSLMTFSLGYYSYDNFEILKSKDLYFSEKYMAFNVAEDNLHLYAHDEELMSKKKQLTVLTFKLQESVLKNITSFILNCTLYNINKANAKQEDQIKLNKEYHELQQPLIYKSLLESKNIFLELHSHQVDFIKILNYKIYQLINVDE